MGLLMRCLILPIADSRENAMILGGLLESGRVGMEMTLWNLKWM